MREEVCTGIEQRIKRKSRRCVNCTIWDSFRHMRAEQWIQGLVHQCHTTQEYTSLPSKTAARWAIFHSPTEWVQFYGISDGWCALHQTLGALYGQQTLSGVSEQHRNCCICSDLWSRNSCLMVTRTSYNRGNNPQKGLIRHLEIL